MSDTKDRSHPYYRGMTYKPITIEDETNVRQHWDGYPHQPGTLYDCPDCESQCFCDDMGLCLFCEIEAAPSAEYREEC